MSSLIRSVPMRKCLETLVHEFHIFIAILNGTCFLCSPYIDSVLVGSVIKLNTIVIIIKINTYIMAI